MTDIEKPVTIGIFDSGVGGLSVLRAIHAQIPCHPVIYLADQAHVPYGARTDEQVREYSEEITRFLLSRGAEIIVVACNTASVAALHHLRSVFPSVPFVGMEPAVKPAASITHSGVIGVLATPVTFSSDMYASVVSRFAHGVTVLQDACPGLVGQIELGALDTIETREILERALLPMLEKHIDSVVMGCTHYPFVIPLIQEIVGLDVQVIDPSPAIARQVSRILAERLQLASGLEIAQTSFFTTSSSSRLHEMLPKLLGEKYDVQYIYWNSGKLG